MLRDALRWRGARARQHRSERSGRAVAELTIGRREDGADRRGRVCARGRPTASGRWSSSVAALYIAIGAFLNYTRVGGYVSDIAWLLALALTLAAAFGFAAGVSTALWLRWRDPPRWLRATAVRTRARREHVARRARRARMATHDGGPRRRRWSPPCSP